MTAITATDLESILNATPAVTNLAQNNRLVVTYRRVVCKRPDGSWPDGSHPNIDRECSIAESFNLVHPDDDRPEQENRRGSKFPAFRELGNMFRGNPSYFDVRYTKVPAEIPA